MAEHTPYERTDFWKSLALKPLAQAVETKFQEMTKMNEGDALKSASPEVLKDFQTRNAELTDMRARLTELRTADEAFQNQVAEHAKAFGTVNRNLPFPGQEGDPNKPGAEMEFKSLADLFTDFPNWKAVANKEKSWSPSAGDRLIFETDKHTLKSAELVAQMSGGPEGAYMKALKATMTTTSGWAPYPTLAPRPPVLTAQIQPVVADLIPQDDTTQATIVYYEETVFTNNADFVGEGQSKPEGELKLEERRQPVCKVAVTLPISDEQLMDVPQVRSYVDGRLTLMVKQKEQIGLLRGNGIAPQLQGFHTKPDIGSIARADGEDNADVFLRAITEVNSITGLANTSGIIMNPLQWLAIRLVRTTTGDYIWGHPSIQGPQTLWGLPVVSTNAELPGLGLVGDFQMFSHISRRMGMRIDVGYINEDFRDNIQRIRLEERLSLEIYRAKAFCEVTNLNSAP